MVVLVVDDHHDTAVLLHRVLTGDGHEVHCAETYTLAMKVAQQSHIHILLTDIQLPDGDGCDLLAEIRALHPHVHGIALTGHGMAAQRSRYDHAGFRAVLIKPVALSDVRAQIAQLAEITDAEQTPKEVVEPGVEQAARTDQ
jgi:CheY-like chemotaxis protein